MNSRNKMFTWRRASPGSSVALTSLSKLSQGQKMEANSLIKHPSAAQKRTAPDTTDPFIPRTTSHSVADWALHQHSGFRTSKAPRNRVCRWQATFCKVQINMSTPSASILFSNILSRLVIFQDMSNMFKLLKFNKPTLRKFQCPSSGPHGERQAKMRAVGHQQRKARTSELSNSHFCTGVLCCF